MKKIEWDTVNGIYEVDEFDSETDIVESSDIDFSDDFEGTRGAIVSATLYREIHKEYGISGC